MTLQSTTQHHAEIARETLCEILNKESHVNYCFESTYTARTLARCKKSDLAVIDTEGHEKAVKNAVSRGVWVYGYLNIGALEKQRPYYDKLKHLRLAKYEGWDDEY